MQIFTRGYQLQIGAQNYPPGLHRWWKKNHISVIWVPPSCHTNKASIPNFRTNRKPNHIGNIFNTSLNIFPSLMVGFLELPIFGWKPIFLHIAPWCYDWTWNEMVGFSSHDTPFVSGPNGMWKSPTRNLWFLWFRWFHFDGPKKGHSLHPPWAIGFRRVSVHMHGVRDCSINIPLASLSTSAFISHVYISHLYPIIVPLNHHFDFAKKPLRSQDFFGLALPVCWGPWLWVPARSR